MGKEASRKSRCTIIVLIQFNTMKSVSEDNEIISNFLERGSRRSMWMFRSDLGSYRFVEAVHFSFLAFFVHMF